MTLFVVITYAKVQFMAVEKGWKTLDCFLLLCGHPVMVVPDPQSQ